MSVNYRGFAWINEDIEHSEHDEVRAKALANKWSELHHADEQRMLSRMADIEDGRYYGPEPCEDCDACLRGDEDNCEVILDMQRKQAEKEAERQIEIELVEDKLAAIGARMMRPYEHWNEDERYMQYMECGRFGE